MEPREPRRRVVLLTTDGIHRLVGTFDPSIHTIRERIDCGFTRGGITRTIQAKLVRVEPRWVLYQQEHA